MIREKKSWLTGILVFALLCTLLLVVPQEHAMAASKKVPAFDKTKQIVFVGDEDSYVDSIKFVNVSSKAKVTNIKFSNPSVLEYAGMHNVNQGIDCRPLKAGKCKISCKVKQCGKTYTLSQNNNGKKSRSVFLCQIKWEKCSVMIIIGIPKL